jgi:hypothetical protein
VTKISDRSWIVNKKNSADIRDPLTAMGIARAAHPGATTTIATGRNASLPLLGREGATQAGHRPSAPFANNALRKGRAPLR